MIARLKYVHKFKDRHGHTRLYFRRGGGKQIPLPDATAPGFLAAYQAALASAAPAPVTKRVDAGSLESLTRGYLGSAKFKQLGPSTRAVYQRILDDLCRQHGAKPVALLQASHIRRMLDAKSDTPAAANHWLRTLRALMAYAIKTGAITVDPTIGVDRLKEAGQGTETWTEEDIATFEAHWAAGTRPRLALALLLYTGQRRSDVVRMGAQHVRNGTITIRQVKTGAELIIPLHPDLAELIDAEPTGRETFLATEKGAPFTANGFYMRFTSWVEAAGLPAGRSPHGLRKAAARRMADAGCTAHQIGAITGHKTLAEVQRYTRAADQARLARDAIAHIGRPKSGNPGSRKIGNPAAND